MITAHNLLAMNANRMYGINAWNLRTTTEKLASGYAINRAADDAAGIQAEIFAFSFNGMQVEIGVSATDTLENIAEDLNGLTFQTNQTGENVLRILS